MCYECYENYIHIGYDFNQICRIVLPKYSGNIVSKSNIGSITLLKKKVWLKYKQ